MISAQFADRVDDLIHLPQGYPVHLLVEFVEVSFNLLVVIGIVFVVAFIEHSQNRLSIPEIRRVLFDIGFQRFKVFFRVYHLQGWW